MASQFLPENRLLGRLEFVETYVFYDKPVLFSCRNAIGNYYLVVLVDEDEESEGWLYVALSEKRFISVRSGIIDLKTAFLEAENGFVFEVHTYFDGQPEAINFLTVSELSDDLLPESGGSGPILTDAS